ncbi:MAG: histone deacetylase family protein [Gammaproteobacteria bacterium]|nr:histone deacetylase family protein [Gammaproteobacteria bacterium]
MFRIRKIYDDASPRNRSAIEQVLEILRQQFPGARPVEFDKLPKQLTDPLKYKYRSVLLVAEDGMDNVKGFAMLLHMPDIEIVYLELVSAAPGGTGGGIGSALYERVREEALSLNVYGIFFECSVDDPKVIQGPETLKQNIARLRFYERYGARPIINNVYASPVNEGDQDLYYLVFDDIGQGVTLRRQIARKVVRAILERKYSDVIPKKQIDEVVNSFRDDPIRLREPRYLNPKKFSDTLPKTKGIALIVNEGHDIHHVRDHGYVEAPVRLSAILHHLNKTSLFTRINPKRTPEKYIKAVHDHNFVHYLRRACARLPMGKSIYPIIFPIRNVARPPKDFELQVGYYCVDTFTPLNHNAYLAARGAVDCAVTGANAILEGFDIAYALVRPPGHHAERRAFGGFCYFNSAAVAANYLSSYGRVAVLDVDFHHGNGTQNIFYQRADVFTVSIHGDPHFAYPHFSGFADEKGEGDGMGYNLNLPLPEKTDVDRYQRTLTRALKKIADFRPAFLVVALGLDTAKADPTGTWQLVAKDFHANGRMIGGLNLPTLVVQEGGYRTRTLGSNARHFFEGLWATHRVRAKSSKQKQAPVK